MVVEVIEISSYMTDEEEIAGRIYKHVGIVIFVHKSKQREKLPFMIIPTQEKKSEEFFREQLTKVQCGSTKDGFSFVKLTLRHALKEIELMLIVKPTFETKFMEVWRKLLPNSKRPQKIDEERLKSNSTFFRKASEISLSYEKLANHYGKQISSMEDQVMMSLYANFMSQHFTLKKKDLMIKLRRDEFRNMPNFIKTYSENATLDFWISNSIKYTIDHQCNLQSKKKCTNYGLKKCSGCRVARYCNIECQTEDWTSHAEECQRWGDHYKTHFLFLGDTLMDILKKRLPGEVKLRLSFEDFMSVVSNKIFELNFEIITDIRFHKKANYFKGTRFDEFVSAEDCKNLLRGAPAQKEDTRKQLENVWGKNEMFDVFDRPPLPAERKRSFDYSRIFGRIASTFQHVLSFKKQ